MKLIYLTMFVAVSFLIGCKEEGSKSKESNKKPPQLTLEQEIAKYKVKFSNELRAVFANLRLGKTGELVQIELDVQDTSQIASDEAPPFNPMTEYSFAFAVYPTDENSDKRLIIDGGDLTLKEGLDRDEMLIALTTYGGSGGVIVDLGKRSCDDLKVTDERKLEKLDVPALVLRQTRPNEWFRVSEVYQALNMANETEVRAVTGHCYAMFRDSGRFQIAAVFEVREITPGKSIVLQDVEILERVFTVEDLTVN